MRWIFYNFFPICLIALAGFMIYMDKAGYGWVIFGAICSSVMPESKTTDISDIKEDSTTSNQ